MHFATLIARNEEFSKWIQDSSCGSCFVFCFVFCFFVRGVLELEVVVGKSIL